MIMSNLKHLKLLNRHDMCLHRSHRDILLLSTYFIEDNWTMIVGFAIVVHFDDKYIVNNVKVLP